jgi:tight adherence protein B
VAPIGLLVAAASFVAALVVTFLIVRFVGYVTTANQRALQERIADYGAQAPAMFVPTTETSILRSRELSSVPWFQHFLRPLAFADSMSLDLAAAGVPLRVGEYLLIRVVLGGSIVAILLGVHLPVIAALPAGFVGWYVPKWYVNRLHRQRLTRFNDQIVDAMTMMSNALKAGSNFLQAFDLVARELPPPLSEEFGHVIAEINLGAPVETALTNLNKRMGSYDLFLMVTAILVQRQTGGNLSEVLDKIADTIRERVRIVRQVQVLTAQEKLSGQLVGILPIVMAVVMESTNPNYFRGFIQHSIGVIFLGAAVLLEILGFIFMNQLSKVKV